MATKKQLQAEIDWLWDRLYQERQDHGDYIRQLRNTACNIANERMHVNQILRERDGFIEILEIIRVEEGSEGCNIIVA